MRKPTKGKDDLVTWCINNNKEYLLSEWDYEINELNPEDYFPKSERTVMWKCNKEPHSYPAPICFRTTRNTGCCYCSGQRVLQGFNDLRTWCGKNNRNDLIDEWSSENEGCLEDYPKSAHKKVKWNCSKCGNTYSALISDRTIKSSGCPYCYGRIPIVGKNDLFTWCKENDREDLMRDWREELNNGNSMEQYTYASDRKVTWKCHVCLHEWTNAVNARTVGNGGCPKCSVNGTSFPEQFIYLVIESLFKSAINRDKTLGIEIDIFIPDIRVAIEYNGTYYHSKLQQTDEKKRQLCKAKEIHLLQIYERVKDFDIDGENIICWKYSRGKDEMIILAKEVLNWISNHTDFEIVEDAIDWDLIYKCARVDTYNVKYENSLEYKSPAVAEEWDFQNNNGIKPSQVSNGSHDLYNWVCRECGTLFAMKINIRTGKSASGCPNCAKKKQINSWISNRTKVKSFHKWCIENDRQDLLSEWNLVRNTISPEDYPAGSNQEVWWYCQKCGNEWRARICNRRKSGCPLCAQKNYGKSVIQLKNGQVVAEYNSITEASKITGINCKSIRKVLQGKQEKTKGFEWQIKKE